MHPRYVDFVSAALATAVWLFAVSCASIPPTNYYVLGPADNPGPTIAESKSAYTLAVAPFESESVYLRKKIIWRSGANQMGYYSHEKWAATPAEMFSYRLYQRAHSSNLFSRVYSGAASDNADLILKGKISAFEELDTPEGWFGRVEARVELLRNDGTVVWSGIAGHTEPAAEQNVKAAVKAIADATEATITAILSSTEQSLQDGQSQ